MKDFFELREATSTIHVIHHPEKGYRQRGGGYSKEINNKTKTFKTHDTAANSDNVHVHTYHHLDIKSGKKFTSVHATAHPGERVHTINHAVSYTHLTLPTKA